MQAHRALHYGPAHAPKALVDYYESPEDGQLRPL